MVQILLNIRSVEAGELNWTPELCEAYSHDATTFITLGSPKSHCPTMVESPREVVYYVQTPQTKVCPATVRQRISDRNGGLGTCINMKSCMCQGLAAAHNSILVMITLPCKCDWYYNKTNQLACRGYINSLQDKFPRQSTLCVPSLEINLASGHLHHVLCKRGAAPYVPPIWPYIERILEMTHILLRMAWCVGRGLVEYL